MDKVEIGASTALVGAGIFSIHSHYKDNAGPLSETRNGGGPESKQKVMDADILTGGLTLLVGGTLSYFTKSPAPLVLAALGFILISGYYHTALNGPAVVTAATAVDPDATTGDFANDTDH
jgi:hypothetical protein